MAKIDLKRRVGTTFARKISHQSQKLWFCVLFVFFERKKRAPQKRLFLRPLENDMKFSFSFFAAFAILFLFRLLKLKIIFILFLLSTHFVFKGIWNLQTTYWILQAIIRDMISVINLSREICKRTRMRWLFQGLWWTCM